MAEPLLDIERISSIKDYKKQYKVPATSNINGVKMPFISKSRLEKRGNNQRVIDFYGDFLHCNPGRKPAREAFEKGYAMTIRRDIVKQMYPFIKEDRIDICFLPFEAESLVKDLAKDCFGIVAQKFWSSVSQHLDHAPDDPTQVPLLRPVSESTVHETTAGHSTGPNAFTKPSSGLPLVVLPHHSPRDTVEQAGGSDEGPSKQCENQAAAYGTGTLNLYINSTPQRDLQVHGTLPVRLLRPENEATTRVPVISPVMLAHRQKIATNLAQTQTKLVLRPAVSTYVSPSQGFGTSKNTNSKPSAVDEPSVADDNEPDTGLADTDEEEELDWQQLDVDEMMLREDFDWNNFDEVMFNYQSNIHYERTIEKYGDTQSLADDVLVFGAMATTEVSEDADGDIEMGNSGVGERFPDESNLPCVILVEVVTNNSSLGNTADVTLDLANIPSIETVLRGIGYDVTYSALNPFPSLTTEEYIMLIIFILEKVWGKSAADVLGWSAYRDGLAQTLLTTMQAARNLYLYQGGIVTEPHLRKVWGFFCSLAIMDDYLGEVDLDKDQEILLSLLGSYKMIPGCAGKVIKTYQDLRRASLAQQN